ncbi:MAG: family 43 glycosylhydrolase [Bacteroidales bacterium]|nr:family 43 glycosylhydrolase [Bacteroidales bacterium]
MISFSCKTGRTDQIAENTDTLFYTNPIIGKYLADPCIIYVDSLYYLFATGGAEDGKFIPIHSSPDLVNWKFLNGAVTNGSETDWNYKHFWAPEVIKIDSFYYLYFTASPKESPENSGNRVGVARSASINGPYETIGIVLPDASIDGHPYIENNQMFMFLYH